MKRKIVLPVLGAACVAAWIVFCGYQWSWGPLHTLHNIRTKNLPGNAAEYDVETVKQEQSSLLTGKNVFFLGSSVTYGASAQGTSFVEYLAKRNNFSAIKEAVSGTTLVDDGPDSYIQRLYNNKAEQVDLFICQLSTNDASQNKPLGTVSGDEVRSGFDTSTVAGAMEEIISYAQNRWQCPVVFYTNAAYESENYSAMVELLPQLSEKWGIGVIDLWHSSAFNAISDEERELYMADSVHPTKAGYLCWWTPEMEEQLLQFLQTDIET